MKSTRSYGINDSFDGDFFFFLQDIQHNGSQCCYTLIQKVPHRFFCGILGQLKVLSFLKGSL